MSGRRCIAQTVDQKAALPSLFMLDPANVLNGELDQYGSLDLGLGGPAASAKVASLTLTSNCVAVVGVTTIDSAGAATREIIADFISSGGDFKEITAGPGMTAAELTKIKAAPNGTGATISWTEGGAPKSQVLSP